MTTASEMGQTSRKNLRAKLGDRGFKEWMREIAKKPRKKAKKKGYKQSILAA